jgi:hypothetical protein
MWYGSRAIDEYSVTDKKGRNKKGRNQIKSRYVICLAIDACLTINTQNNKINKTPIIEINKTPMIASNHKNSFAIYYDGCLVNCFNG